MRRGLLPLLLGSVWIAPGALAQDRAVLPPDTVRSGDGDAGAALRRNLTTLAHNPRSVVALNGAGAAALEMGDADAALSFFTRAADADPASPRAKAGMARALVHLERASEALPLFTEAVRMGAPEAELAADRGLAWDVLGYPARAQADYALSLRREDDPEVRRRLALSLAISGRRAEALQVIAPQLQANDRAAWRAQAFVLALTGDADGAGRTARNMMPDGAAAMDPFFRRLAGLSPSQKALAAHFGHFPSDGRAQSFAAADSAADPGALALAQGNVPVGAPRPRARQDVPASPLEAGIPSRRRPDSGATGGETRIAAQIRPAPANPAQAAPRRQYSAPSFLEGGAQGGPPPPQQYAAAQPGTPAPAWPTPVLDERQSPYPARPPSPPSPAPRRDDSQSPGFTLVPQGRPLGRAPEAVPQRSPERPLADFSIVTSAVEGLEDEEGGAVAPPVRDIAPPVRAPARPTRTAGTPVNATTRAGRTARQTPAQANPARYWVQVATGSNRAGLLYTYGQFRRQAPNLLGGRAAYAVSNRLLVGPFPSEDAAASFARQLAARGVRGHSWTSEAGQRIDQLQAANETRSTARTRTAQAERAGADSRSARGSAGSRSERAAANTRSGRNGSAAGNRSGTTGTAAAGRSGRSSGSTAAAGRSGRNSTGSARNAGAAAGRGGSARNNGKPTEAGTRASRRGSPGQSGSSARRGRRG